MAMGREGDRQGRSDRDLGGDAALAGARVLRPAAGSSDRGRFRRVCRDGVPAVSTRRGWGRRRCRRDGTSACTWSAISRGSTASGARLALFGLPLAARFPAAGADQRFPITPGCRTRGAAAARGPREGVRLGAEARRRARSGEGQADRRRRLDDGGQRRAAHDPAARHRRDLSRDADADGQGERHRDADRGDLPLDRARKGKKLSNADWTSRPIQRRRSPG